MVVGWRGSRGDPPPTFPLPARGIARCRGRPTRTAGQQGWNFLQMQTLEQTQGHEVCEPESALEVGWRGSRGDPPPPFPPLARGIGRCRGRPTLGGVWWGEAAQLSDHFLADAVFNTMLGLQKARELNLWRWGGRGRGATPSPLEDSVPCQFRLCELLGE